MLIFKDSLKIKYTINLLGCLLIAGLIALTGCWGGFGEPYEKRYEEVETIAIDIKGNVFVLGEFPGTVDFDPGPGQYELTASGFTDVFFSKFDPDGNFLWARNWGGDGWCSVMKLALDSSGNVYITGSVSGTIDLDPGPNVFEHSSNWLKSDSFLSKFDPDGNLLWAKIWGGDNFDAAMSVAIDEYGNSYVTGKFWGTADMNPDSGRDVQTATPEAADEFSTEGMPLRDDAYPDVYLSKFDTDGNFIWTRVWGAGGYDSGEDIIVDELGNPVIVGFFRSTVDFDPGPGVDTHSEHGRHDLFLSKFDSNGNFLWAGTWGGSDYDFMSQRASDGVENTNMDIRASADGNGNTFLQGLFYGTVDLDPGPGKDDHTSTEYRNPFLLKLDSSGRFIWARSWSGPEVPAGSETPEPDASVYSFMHGRRGGTGPSTPGGPRETGFSSGEDYALLISRFDSDGNLLCTNTFGDRSAWDYWRVAIDGNGNTLVSGTFTGTVDLDPGPGVDERTPEGVYDLFLSKFNPDGNVLWTQTWGLTKNDVVEVYD